MSDSVLDISNSALPLKEEVSFELIKLLAKADKESSANTFQDDTEYPLVYRVTATALHVIIFILGVAGNLAFLTRTCRKQALQTPAVLYMQSTSVAFLLVLVTSVPDAIVSHYLGLVWISGAVGCAAMVFVHLLSVNVASCSVLAAVVHFCCDARQSFRSCSVNAARKVIAGLWLFAFMYSAPWLGLTLVKPYPGRYGQDICDFRITNDAYVKFFVIDSTMFYILPSIGAIVALSAIHSIVNRKKELVQVTTANSDEFHDLNGDSRLISRPDPGPIESVEYGLSQSQHVESSANIYSLLWCVSLSMVVCGLPSRSLLLHNCIAQVPWLDIYFMLFAKTASFINAASLPYILMASSRTTRQGVCGSRFLSRCGT